MKRKYFNNLGKLIKCCDCNFDIFAGSDLQRYFAQLIISMVFSLTPFELLDWKTYKEYYETYIGGSSSSSIKIKKRTSIGGYSSQQAEEESNPPQNLKKSNVYFTNCNKLWNQIYFTLFAQLLGSHKTTRYQHMLCFTSEFYCHNAYALKSTPRGLYGTDAGEHYNDKVKTLVHVISNKFKNYEDSKLPPIAIDLIMKYCLWEYYQVRGQDNKRDTTSIRSNLKKKQKSRDIETLKRPSQICKYFEEQDVPYKLLLSQYDQEVKKYNEIYQDSDYIIDYTAGDTDAEDLREEQTIRLQLSLDSNLERINDYLRFRHEADLDLNDPNHRLCYVMCHTQKISIV